MAEAGARGRTVGIDVGGTKCLGVAVDQQGRLTASARRPTPQAPAELVATLAELAAALGPPATLGVGLPGLITRTGELVASAHLPAMAGRRLAAELTPRVGVPVVVANDATCATRAEWTLGAGAGLDDLVLVTLGTGIGGGLVAGGRLIAGHHGFAGEFGHMVVDPGGVPCPCGRRGCWERYASGTGLARLARAAAQDGRAARILALAGGDPRDVDGEHVQSAARAGDPEARAVVDEFARWVAVGLANLTNALDPAAIILGGGLADGADLYLAPIRAHFATLLYGGDHRPRPDVRFARLGPEAGAVGAALMASDAA